MFKTLVLLRIRGCFDIEVEEGGGIEERVWTLEKENRIRFIILGEAKYRIK